jgi:hypothetical protein
LTCVPTSRPKAGCLDGWSARATGTPFAVKDPLLASKWAGRCNPHVMGDEDAAYWRWRDELLKHPSGRAKGGEPCVQCGGPIPPNAGWVQRDRHLCSSSCNLKRSRWFLRELRKSSFDTEPEPRPNPRTDIAPRIFRTLAEPVDGVPYEFSGYEPRNGDALERLGVVTGYCLLDESALPAPFAAMAKHGAYIAVHVPSMHRQIWAATPAGGPSRLQLCELDPDGIWIPVGTSWRHEGIEYRWGRELINDVTSNGIDYRWDAIVARPVDAPLAEAFNTSAYQAFADARARATASNARHARRVRLESATVERFDPHEIYQRDDWVCQLCLIRVDPHRAWPDPMAASLDHITPLAAGGEHSRANSQLAHWICNVRKGARTGT